MKTNNLLRKVLTAILSFTFIVSSVFGALPFVASATDYSTLTPRATIVSDDTVELPPAPTGTTNVIKGLIPTVYSNKGNGDTIVDDPDLNKNNATQYGNKAMKHLTDEDVTTFNDIGGFRFNNNGVAANDYSLAMTFDFKAINEISQMVIIHHNTTACVTDTYAVFASNSISKLYNKESFLYYCDNSDKHNRRNILTFEAGTKARYVGIRIFDPGDQTAGNNQYVRLRELAFYGVKGEPIPDDALFMMSSSDTLALDSTLGEKNFMENIDKPLKAVYSKDSGSTEQSQQLSSDLTQKLGDGNLTESLNLSDWKFAEYNASTSTEKYIGDGIELGKYYVDIYIPLGTRKKITGFQMINAESPLATSKYDIYVSNSEEELFKKEENRIFTADNSEGKRVNTITLEKVGEELIGSFVGIRIYDPTNKKNEGIADANKDGENNIFVRINEFAVYGSEYEKDLFDDDTQFPDWGKNLALGFAPTIFNASGNPIASNNDSLLTDGSASGDMRVSGYRFAENNLGNIVVHTSRGDGTMHIDVVLDIKSEATINGIVLMHHSQDQWKTYDYEIFASTDYEKLFETESSRGRVQNDAHRRNAINYNVKGQSFKARYIAIRVYDPTQKAPSQIDTTNCANIYLRLVEFAIYGEYTDPNFVYKEPFIPLSMQSNNDVFESFGTSLLSGMLPSEMQSCGSEVSNIKDAVVFTDGEVSTGYDYTKAGFGTQDGSNYFQMVYSLTSESNPKRYSFTDFIYLGLNQNNLASVTGWWQLYISEDYDILFDEANMAFEYNAIRSDSPDPKCSGQLINFDEPKIGSYIGIRILACNTTSQSSVYPRIYEIAAYGEEIPLDSSPVNIATDMPVSAYLHKTSGDITEVSSSNLTVKEIQNLTDGSASTSATIKTSKKTLSLLYNLCQDIQVSEIKVTSATGKTYINKYKVYASDDINKVWDKSSLVYSYDGKGSPKMTTGKVFSKAKKMRYVRIEILDKNETVSIGEIEVIGPKYRQLKSRNLLKGLSENAISFFTQSIKTGKQDQVIVSNINKLNNNSFRDAMSITKGYEGKDTVDIIITYDDMRTFNGLKLYFAQRAWEFMPTLTNVYVGTNYDDLIATDAEPICTYKGLPKDSLIDVSFAPTLGRFMRISFVKGGNGYDYFEEMTYAISEIQTFGTKVSGMNIKSDNVLDFEDKKLGIKWGIVRAVNNDIYTNVVSSKVFVDNVTNWQKRSLEKTPYLKVVGGKRYTFKFYDVTGKEVTDFEGRQIEIAFKFRDGMTSSTAMCGYAGNKWYIEPYDTHFEKLENYAYIYEEEKFDDLTFSMLNIIGSQDPYWSSIGELEDYGDEEPQYAPTTDVDENTTTATFITEDGDFYLDPRGALRLPKRGVFSVEAMTWNIPEDFYSNVSASGVVNPDEIAATYRTDFTEDDISYLFEGTVKLKLRIPEVLKGYFSSYQLVSIDENGFVNTLDYTREGEYIYFETASLDNYALIGQGYDPAGNAVYEDFQEDSENIGESPETGDSNPIIYVIIALMSLSGIVVLNSKKLRTQK